MTYIKQQYAILDQHRCLSNKGSGPMTIINMRGITDNRHYVTFVVDTYKNYRNWKNIIMNPAVGYIVTFENGKLSRSGHIDADSIPTVTTTASTQDIQAILDEVHNLKPKKYKPTKAEMIAQVDAMRATIETLFE